ncbi:Glycosyltransferase involved in cell wall bisynthesis [Pedobacter westerhofensis]|uniref:Glycosyltransferase involved in cell wall bisynthesis n=1 Tax=Pedobacter westerhofensis TaxID=425512 RepID=A0A521FJT4_9SPHI|nr:glycosyltransferase [Pedobacter westerhofensis]SMO96482.1 Glycosyltransferase involved in cell wall bisynthesis [Pedobacter westerhofensis]
MRVLVVHTYYKLKGGEDSVVANEIALLRGAGAEVEQLTFSNSGSTLLKLLQVPFNYGSYRKTLRKIREFKPDVVHIHNLHFSGSAAVVYAIDQMKVPVVMTLHNYRLLCPSGSLYHNNELFMDSLEPGFAWQAVKKGVYQNSKAITFWIAASMYLHEKLGTWKKINRFIVLGKHSKDLFALSKFGRFADHIVVKPNFCFSGSVSTETGSGYLYIGRLTEEKGLPVLLKAFAASGHSLNIVGTGPLEELVKEYSSGYSNISFLGAQPIEKVYEMMEKTRALIFPSVWYETFGMVVIEAFSRGVPVIASDLGNIKNLVDDGVNGLRFTAGDEGDLMKKVAYFEEQPAEARAAFRANARQAYLNQYSPEANAVQLIGLYREIAPGAD